jgi:hypothetical protein
VPAPFSRSSTRVGAGVRAPIGAMPAARCPVEQSPILKLDQFHVLGSCVWKVVPTDIFEADAGFRLLKLEILRHPGRETNNCDDSACSIACFCEGCRSPALLGRGSAPRRVACGLALHLGIKLRT